MSLSLADTIHELTVSLAAAAMIQADIDVSVVAFGRKIFGEVHCANEEDAIAMVGVLRTARQREEFGEFREELLIDRRFKSLTFIVPLVNPETSYGE